MYSNNRNGSCAVPARGFMALFAILAIGLGLLGPPAEAAPFAYVANEADSTVSMIDTATNTVEAATLAVGNQPNAIAVTSDGLHAYVANGNFYGLGGTVSVVDTATNTVEAATLAVGSLPEAIAVTPDGKHVYVVNFGSNNVSVIATATNTVVATVGVGSLPRGVAVSPDGKHAYVTNDNSNNISVIDTATDTVEAAALAVGANPVGIAVTPDGKHAYVTNLNDNTVSVIDTATNTVEPATLAVGAGPSAVAVTPDGLHAYVVNGRDNNVSIIDTATNTVEAAKLAVGSLPVAVAVAPDGKHAYVVNENSNNVSVIDTATNTVEAATLAVGNLPFAVGIVPPPPGVPFLAFNTVLNIDFGTAPNTDAFMLGTSFTLSSTAPAFNPLTDPVTLHIGTFAVTIPGGSFFKTGTGKFSFEGMINGVTLKVAIKHTGTLRYTFQAGAQNASLTGTQNAVYVTLAIGGGNFSNSGSGATSVTAKIFGTSPAVTAAKFH